MYQTQTPFGSGYAGLGIPCPGGNPQKPLDTLTEVVI
jgi:hypothetical protein